LLLEVVITVNRFVVPITLKDPQKSHFQIVMKFLKFTLLLFQFGFHGVECKKQQNLIFHEFITTFKEKVNPCIAKCYYEAYFNINEN